jgi:hypothetical protein
MFNFIHCFLIILIVGSFLCVGCGSSSDQPTEIETPEVMTVPIEFPPGDPRNEVLQTIRYPNHGEAEELGMARFGGASVNITQYGRILEGGEGHFLIGVERGEVEGVYVWIGTEADGKKRKWPATPEPEGFHVHCAVPRPLKEDHALWVEIRLPSGERHHGKYDIGDE